MTSTEFISAVLEGRTGMQIPLHDKFRNERHEIVPLTKAVSFFLNGIETHHIAFEYEDANPTTISSFLVSGELKKGPYIQ